jgi:hypothetical protein
MSSWRDISKAINRHPDPSLDLSAAAVFLDLSTLKINLTAVRDVFTEAANAIERCDVTSFQGRVNKQPASYYAGVLTKSLRNIAAIGAFIPAMNSASKGLDIDEILLSLGDMDLQWSALQNDLMVIWDVIAGDPTTTDGRRTLLDSMRIAGPLLYLIRSEAYDTEMVGRVARVLVKAFEKHMKHAFTGVDKVIGMTEDSVNPQKNDVTQINFTNAN